MRIFILASITVICVFFSCKKYKNLKATDDVQDTCQLRGRLFLLDTLTQQAEYTPLGNKKVFLFYADATDTINYLHSRTTNADGYFSFENLNRNKSYRVVYEEKITEKIYRADTTTQVPEQHLQLISHLAVHKQPGLYIRVIDTTGAPVAKASVCLFFNNAGAFQAGKCEAGAFDLKTDAYGRANIIGVQPGTYYVLASATIGGNTFTGKETIEVGKKIEFPIITIKAGKSTLLQYTILDRDGFTVSGAKVCLFTSPGFYSRDTCEGSNYSDSTNAEGVVNFRGLPKNEYYTIVDFKLGSTVYIARDTIVVEDGASVKESLRLQLK